MLAPLFERVSGLLFGPPASDASSLGALDVHISKLGAFLLGNDRLCGALCSKSLPDSRENKENLTPYSKHKREPDAILAKQKNLTTYSRNKKPDDILEKQKS